MDTRRLFVTYGGAHAHILAPLINAFEEQAPGSTVVLALTGAAAVLRDQYQIDSLKARDFADGVSAEGRRAARRLIAQMQESGQRVIDVEESECYLGYGIQGLVRTGLSINDAIGKVEAEGRSVLWPIGLVERVFDKYPPSLVVTTNSPRAEKAAQFLAAERGIKSALIPDLFCIFEHYPLRADRIFVMTTQAKRNLVQRYGTHGDNVVVSGNPYYEQAAREISFEKKDSGGKAFAWFEQNGFYDSLSGRHVFRDVEDLKKTLAELLSACDDNGYQLVARRHPSQDAARFASACLEISERIVVDESKSAQDLVAIADLCGSTASTVLMQAISAGTPVLQVIDGVQPAIDLRGINSARTVAEDAHKISQSIQSLEAEQVVAEDPLNSRGATDRIIAELLRLESLIR